MATATVLQEADVIEYVSGSALARGEIVRVGHVVGVCVEGLTAADITAGRKASMTIEGGFIVPKKTGTAWTQGQAAYWDDGDEDFHVVASGRYFAGFVIEAAGSSDTTGKIAISAMDT